VALGTSSLTFRKLSKILPIRVFGFGVGVGVASGFGVAECLATARFWIPRDGSGEAVGEGGIATGFSGKFGDPAGAADSTGLGEVTGVGIGVDTGSRVGLGSGIAVGLG
jgi:hypothetical protein